MRIFFFRHGDPDYTIDSLTEKGRREAQILADHIKEYDLDDIYVSPLGRASLTAEYSLKTLGREGVVCDWLREFYASFDPNKAGEEERRAYANELKTDPITGRYVTRIVWDIMPSYYMDHQELFDVNGWRTSPLVAASDMNEIYDHVASSFDDLLASYGYERSGNVYTTKCSNEKRIGLFCHFGVTSVILSHLWNISPFVPLQFTGVAPTAVTEVATEEREKGIVIFRALRIGDISHLSEAKEAPSFSARFCERFENEDERH